MPAKEGEGDPEASGEREGEGWECERAEVQALELPGR